MLVMDACEVGYHAGAGRWGSGGGRLWCSRSGQSSDCQAASLQLPGITRLAGGQGQRGGAGDRSHSSDHTLLTHQQSSGRASLRSGI